MHGYDITVATRGRMAWVWANVTCVSNRPSTPTPTTTYDFQSEERVCSRGKSQIVKETIAHDGLSIELASRGRMHFVSCTIAPTSSRNRRHVDLLARQHLEECGDVGCRSKFGR